MEIDRDRKSREQRANRAWAALMKIGAKTGCHQKYERSFSLGGFQFPLCARCTGLLAGQAAAFAALLAAPIRAASAGALALPALISVLILGVDGTGQLAGFWVSNNPRRFWTGILCGFFTALFYIKLFALIPGFIAAHR